MSDNAERLRDLDETRRLCYVALMAPQCNGRHDLAGTLVHALIHHSNVIDVELPIVTERVQRIVTGSCGEFDLSWLRSTIRDLSAMQEEITGKGTS